MEHSDHPKHNTTQEKTLLTVPVSIVTAGALIALSILIHGYMLTGGANSIFTGNNNAALDGKKYPDTIKKSDHIYGNKDAKFVFVEYSDTECPFCKMFHTTLKTIVDNSGGKIAWVYRYYPLDIHPKAPKEAEALECAAELGGEEMFWKYLDKLFVTTPANNGLDPAKLPAMASELGLDTSAFNNCLASGKYAERVNEDKKDAATYGVDGTPNTFFMKMNRGKLTMLKPINGAQPKETVQAIVDSAMK